MRHRFIALGASNLTRCVLAFVDAARNDAAAPVDVHAALGFGRSFGMTSRVLLRELPSIDACGLWTALSNDVSVPTTALVMDVGNDLLYGIEVPQILDWVERSLVRLQPHAERRIVVGLPMQSLRQLSAWRFTLVRTVLWPRCRLQFAATLDMAEQLHAGLERLALRHGAMFQGLPGTWYGFDPVHIQRRHRTAAVRQLLSLPPPAGCGEPFADTLGGRLRGVFAAPAERRLLGCHQRRPQPARRWPDGTTLSLW